MALTKAQKQMQMQQLLLDTIVSASEATSWDTIVTTVMARYTVKNWLTEVRGPLQALINAGKIYRTASIDVEEYLKSYENRCN